ncbi:MAG TPA: sigma-70 family RNA polymerase sigma factor [Kofleriaceae bacterium]|nr:sigma-70 family RNA polymerase sigma factor [Kofleriaceae bacterium]
MAAGDQASVAELVAGAQAGDQDAFAELYQRFARAVHGAVLARVPPGEARDLVQDVFLIAWKRIRSVREPAAFAGWLLMIARNRSTDYHRRTRAEAELPADLGAAAPPSAEAIEVLAVIRGLPEAYRETLVMRLVEGMSGPEIAEQTGMTAASVRVNLCRGMKLLRAALGLEGGA